MEVHKTNAVLNKNGDPEATCEETRPIQIMEHSTKQLAWTQEKMAVSWKMNKKSKNCLE